MVHRLAPEAEANLDEIWLYIANQSGGVEASQRVIDAVTERFYLLSCHPRLGRPRDDLAPGLRSHPVGEYVILYEIEDEDVLILYVFHGRQDIIARYHGRP